MYNVQCTMHKVQCTKYNVQCAMYNVQFTYNTEHIRQNGKVVSSCKCSASRYKKVQVDISECKQVSANKSKQYKQLAEKQKKNLVQAVA